jgi:glycerol uptake facilitator protein
MTPFSAELIGTALLVLFGDGVVANVVLRQTKGNNSGWIVITAGWAFAVTIAVYCTNAVSGAHLNPAVTLGLASIGRFPVESVAPYLLAQCLGGMLGAVLVWLSYLPHWEVSSDPAGKLAVFCTAPAIRRPAANLLCEGIGTAVLVFGVLAIASPRNLQAASGWDKGFAPALVGVLVWALGLSLGGPTGYAINPARDLGPRIAHALLPIAGKGGSDWGYAWVPVVGPVVGGIVGAQAYRAFFGAA